MMEQKSVAILLAVYNPPLDWFAELLDSLDAQTYENLHIRIRDDASVSPSPAKLEAVLEEHLLRVPYTLLRNDRNIGSNATFAALVKDATEDLVAFCDQDDIWFPDKIERSVKLLEQSPLNPVLVCSEVSVIDADGHEIAPSISAHRKRHVFLRGPGLAPTLLHRNFALGCTMLLSRERALSYLPFPDGIIHDHYLAYRAACDGAIDYLPEPTMRYRVYGGNQTGVMVGVRTKRDYYETRILVFDRRLAEFSRYADFPELIEARRWGDARRDNFARRKGSFRRLRSLRHVNRATTLFELYALRMPSPLFRLAIRLIQKRIL